MNVLFSSKSVEWSTPQDLFNYLDSKFHFDLDPCASIANYKCSNFYTSFDDGLSKPWFGSVFCNPPYGRFVISKWVDKAIYEFSSGHCDSVVLLLPCRSDTKWFKKLVDSGASFHFIQGRLHFNDSDRAPFPSVIFILEHSQTLLYSFYISF